MQAIETRYNKVVYSFTFREAFNLRGRISVSNLFNLLGKRLFHKSPSFEHDFIPSHHSREEQPRKEVQMKQAKKLHTFK